ncbi:MULTISPECIES: hypothetical protein [Asticcacaulis]|uniref:hypothetical protein n=1 Tax=Asticcacaulis TaxID=76890 RepID=UPI001AE841CA|nr:MULTISPECIES: hypothetical protein [Asticcacaulis]MBP2159079.1 hypothetical protein [Asticcacaulis solisilvae]MDR6800124.1 hypothetical protein [Asticcacaulis sp. BE141]
MALSFEPLMFGFLGIVIIVLAGCVFVTWRVEVRVWLIPRSVVRGLAEDMMVRYGQAARRESAKRELDAFTKGNTFEAGKWARVTAYLRDQDRKAAKAVGDASKH